MCLVAFQNIVKPERQVQHEDNQMHHRVHTEEVLHLDSLAYFAVFFLAEEDHEDDDRRVKHLKQWIVFEELIKGLIHQLWALLHSRLGVGPGLPVSSLCQLGALLLIQYMNACEILVYCKLAHIEGIDF